MVRFLLGSCVAALALAALMLAGRHLRAGGHVRAWEALLAELRVRARPASERVAHGPSADDLRRELAELDRLLQEVARGQDPVVPQLDEGLSGSDLELQRALVERARPALVRWLRVEPCATPPGDAPADSEAWLPLRARVEARLLRGERIAMESPRLLNLRVWSDLLAWHAWFEAQTPPGDDGFAIVGPADVLASIFPVAGAFDDGSLIGAMVRVAVEAETLQAGSVLLRQPTVSPRLLRAALEPWLVRSSEVEPRELVEGELHWFLERSLTRLPEGAAKTGTDADLLLQYFGGVESAFELAPLPWGELEGHRRSQADTSSLANVCVSAFETLHRHRSVLALARVALALEEHRERNGTFPASLADLAALFPEGLPTDPLTGAPFPYAIHGAHARLGPAACPEHGGDGERNLDWAAAVESLAAWDL